ncbi:MAG: hypothetical protein N4J56_004680 [Chroococcidiopsis sp. SAG 2025]|uniref:hypothetical protein n=1 Tax=Chroococcidiopsis sp. SAG 2025 TaxID=171389 RepID=UPI0029371111|nr:hypothetical protein [Chroococcidiopsis sp. SAG 2025]MDV2995026.1 hypothetical protein [Chroococcidiopsis sp. SAG 2025]
MLDNSHLVCKTLRSALSVVREQGEERVAERSGAEGAIGRKMAYEYPTYDLPTTHYPFQTLSYDFLNTSLQKKVSKYM